MDELTTQLCIGFSVHLQFFSRNWFIKKKKHLHYIVQNNLWRDALSTRTVVTFRDAKCHERGAPVIVVINKNQSVDSV